MVFETFEKKNVMKSRFIVALAVLFSGLISAQEIKWMSMNEALEAQKKEPKKIFMDAYTTWCGPCKMLDKNTFQNKDVAKYINEHFYAVKFNAEGTETIDYNGMTYENPNYNPNKRGRNSQHQFASYLRVQAYPTMIFFDENSKVITPVMGYKTPTQLEIFLKMIASDDYKEVTTNQAWAEYQKNFKSTFKN